MSTRPIKDAEGKKLNPFQQALIRPAPILGSTATVNVEKYIAILHEDPTDDDPEVEKIKIPQITIKKVVWNQGLFRIVIEACSNAIDNVWESKKIGITPKMIKIGVNQQTGMVFVENDGRHIPVEIQRFTVEDYKTGKILTENSYPAEEYFGSMNTGTNYVNDKTRKTSGRNGMGAKAVVIFSTETIIEHSDPTTSKKLVLRFGKNGKTREKPVVTPYRKAAFTRVSFIPDYAGPVFNYPGCDDNFVGGLKKIAYDMAMITGLPVEWTFIDAEGSENREILRIKNLEGYVKLYFPEPKEAMRFLLRAPCDDECVVIERPNPANGQLEEPMQMSWINGINTSKGGTHVTVWKNEILTRFLTAFNKTRKEGEQKATLKDVYAYLMLFVRAERPDIDFESQAKEELTKPVDYPLYGEADRKAFIEEINKKIIAMMKWNFVALLREKLDLQRNLKDEKKENQKRKTFDPKVTDADDADKRGAAGEETYFWLAEGDSALRFIERLITGQGEAVIRKNGWYPIKGKNMNPSRHTITKFRNNKECSTIKEVLGLKWGMTAADRHLLRYRGGVIIAADADLDGDHIRGLLLNFFYKFWPTLVEEGYIYFFFTAVVRIKQQKKMIPFYNEIDFNRYIREHPVNKDNINYYKGLATHKPGDEKLYSEDPRYGRIVVTEDSSDAIDRSFNPDRSNDRKTWIKGFFNLENKESVLEGFEYSGDITIEKFVNGPLLVFSAETTNRAIPDAIDGQKKSHRQALCGMFYLDPKKHKSIEELSGPIKSHVAYHHGGVSLQDCIMRRTQGFVGSNNIPLFENGGESGTRVEGGKDAGASRYVETKLEAITKLIFRKEDEPILEWLEVDGKKVEPARYIPIIPMALVNGSDGISTGWRTESPNYNPEDLIAWAREYLGMIEADPTQRDCLPDFPTLKPWYRGFKGEITIDPEYPPKWWCSKGILQKKAGNKWEITELPIGVWRQKAKEELYKLYDPSSAVAKQKAVAKAKTKAKIQKRDALLAARPIERHPSMNEICFIITPTRDFTPDMDEPKNPFHKLLVRTKTLNLFNFLNSKGIPTRFSAAEEIALDHAKARLEAYAKRKTYWLKEWEHQLVRASNKYIFVKAVVDKKLNLNQEDEVLEELLRKTGLVKLSRDGDSEDESGKPPSYDYLLSMHMGSMTAKKLLALQKEADDLRSKIAEYRAVSVIDMWRNELDEFEESYKKFLRTRRD